MPFAYGCHGLVVIMDVDTCLQKKFSLFRSKYVKKKVTEISRKIVQTVSTVLKTVLFQKVSSLPIAVLKKYRVTVPRYCPPLRISCSLGLLANSHLVLIVFNIFLLCLKSFTLQ